MLTETVAVDVRYARQIAVPGFGREGQARLRRARLVVVGAGGLAAPALQYLVGAGAGHVTLIDPDEVDLSNLHRQTLFREVDLGHPKAEVAARQMAALNPDSPVEPVIGRIGVDNVETLTRGADVVLDCADSFAASYVLSDHCLERKLPLISASVLGNEGYCGGFCGSAPSLRAVFPNLPRRLGSCAEDGVLGPVVGVIGALQSQMAIAVIVGQNPSPLGRLVSFEAIGFRFGGFRFDGANEPSWRPRFIAASGVRDTDFVVDLRGANEAPLAAPRALRSTVDAFGPGGPLPEPGQRAVLCCRTGLRSWQAAERLGAVWDGEVVLVALQDFDIAGRKL